jgi:hypothetical protein
MDQCNGCSTWLVKCPCCEVFFCPDCMRTEDEMEESYDEED